MNSSPARPISAPPCCARISPAPISTSIASPGNSIPPCSSSRCRIASTPPRPRVAAGLGTLARVVAENKPIYRDRLTLDDARMRIEGIYHPYHAALQKLLGEAIGAFGVALLIDCHSMPRITRSDDKAAPDIVLGDRYGTTCAPGLVDLVETVFTSAGLACRPQPPLCRRLCHPHLWPPAAWRACPADRDQPPPLYERGDAGQARRLRRHPRPHRTPDLRPDRPRPGLAGSQPPTAAEKAAAE